MLKAKDPFDFVKALSDFKKASELDPNDAIVYFNRGNLSGKVGKYTEAIADHTKAIERSPKYDPAYLSRAHAYALVGKSEQAKKDLLKAVELNPSLRSQVKQLSNHHKLNLKLD